MKEKIKHIMKQVFELEHVYDNISQLSCEKWDSLGSLNLVVNLEEEFDVVFEPDDIIEMISLESIELKIIEIKKKQ
jgi:acyl carrier protein